MSRLVVNPLNTVFFFKNVTNDNENDTKPPTSIDPFIRYNKLLRRSSFLVSFVSADLLCITLASNVCTAIAILSHICVVANPNVNVRF